MHEQNGIAGHHNGHRAAPKFAGLQAIKIGTGTGS
jgi:hypothetical protein